jgi:hypothetical protein
MTSHCLISKTKEKLIRKKFCCPIRNIGAAKTPWVIKHATVHTIKDAYPVEKWEKKNTFTQSPLPFA